MLLPEVRFDHGEQRFAGGGDVDAMVASMEIPLSLTFQLTRACNYECVYCSEPPGIPTSSPDAVKAMLDKLVGMRRIILSGGEPMLYKQFWEILEYARARFEIVVLSTNGSYITRDNAHRPIPGQVANELLHQRPHEVYAELALDAAVVRGTRS
ncbi:MAG: radical SAM protein [Myxococcaceae bacterium]|nr:MAG: radical SAM protein [Myxococcaceae bacterium]